MRSRRLPGSRGEPGQPGPGARSNHPAVRPPPALFDGDPATRALTPVAKQAPEPPPASAMTFGPRSLLALALLAQGGAVALMLPRLVTVLDAISMKPNLLVPLAALGALGVGLFGWAFLLRSMGAGITYCIVAVAWWGYFFAQSL